MTNHRTDKWGGGPEQRTRFVVEALKRVRARVGESMALGIRINGQESRHGGYDNLEMREMLYCIGETGLLDFVDIDTGHCWGAPSYVPSSYHPHAEFREFGKAARADLALMERKIAVLFTGRINDPVLAEELIKNGYCDLVGMVRAGIADPEFANKAREGRLGEIRRCIGCTRCIDEASEPATMPYTPTCSINPVIGNELRWEQQYRPAEKPKRVVVVGGGIAGCEAARVAAMRGHQVILLEQGKRLGGQLLIAATCTGPGLLRRPGLLRGKRDGAPGRRRAPADRCGYRRDQGAVAARPWSSRRARSRACPTMFPASACRTWSRAGTSCSARCPPATALR